MPKPNWKKLILEMLMVMIGVLLALLVDEWREERQIDEMVSLTEERVLSEIRENLERLKNFRSNLQERFEELQSWEQAIDPDLSFREQRGFPGMPGVSLNNAAWQRANSSDMTNYMDNDFIERAYGLYHWNDRILNAEDRILDPIFSPIGWDRSQTQVTYNIVEDIFREVQSQVRQSIESYEAFADLYPE